VKACPRRVSLVDGDGHPNGRMARHVSGAKRDAKGSYEAS